MAVCLVAAGYSGFVPVATTHLNCTSSVGTGPESVFIASTSAAADTDVANATA